MTEVSASQPVLGGSPPPVARFLMAAGCSLLLAIFAGAWAFHLLAWQDPHTAHTEWLWLRPTHVTFGVAWIFLAAIGGILAFLPAYRGRVGRVRRMASAMFWIFALAGLIAFGGYLTGHRSGREYLHFIPLVSVLIAAAWILFIILLFRSLRQADRPWPVWYWMWLTGAVAFAWTFVEAHLHWLPWFADHPIRDLGVQWKAYGGLTGSWNMLVYGLLLCLGNVLGGSDGGRSHKAFFFYWLGLTNLMFGYAHHTYSIPQSLWIRWMAFVISMTEWVVLLSLLADWARPWGRKWWRAPPRIAIPRAFVIATSVWIGLNLLLALLISIPSINWVTHGTYVVMAHAMGSMFGINSMILFGVGFYWMLHRTEVSRRTRRLIGVGIGLANLAMLALFALLVVAGLVDGWGTTRSGWSFHQVRDAMAPYLYAAGWAATALLFGLATLLAAWIPTVLKARPDQFGGKA